MKVKFMRSLFAWLFLICIIVLPTNATKASNDTLTLGSDVTPDSHAQHENHWILRHSATGFEYDTQTGVSSRGGVEKKGLLSASRSGKHRMSSWWEMGAFRPTIMLDSHIVISGKGSLDVARISSFRFDKNGSTVWIRTTKGPDARVALYQDDSPTLDWPRGSPVSVVSYTVEELIVSIYDQDSRSTRFWRYGRQAGEHGFDKPVLLGDLADCAVMASKRRATQLVLEVFCSLERGADVLALDLETGSVTIVLATEYDDMLAFGLAKGNDLKSNRQAIPVLTLSGSLAARQLYHAVSASLLTNPGEPMSRASDEAGTQSWSQSWRTLALGLLYGKTDHPVFAALAASALSQTLDNQNDFNRLADANNPSCAWASRIYSEDGVSPLSLLVNQAMISTALTRSCKRIGGHCSHALKSRINTNARCLVAAYEQDFDPSSGLYRIPYDSTFRFDGLWAPWNWQMTWAGVLGHVGDEEDRPLLSHRSHTLTTAFVDSWEIGKSRDHPALWRYWPEPFYQGWQASDLISTSRPVSHPRKMEQERYEDLSHAGISLLALSEMGHTMSEKNRGAVSDTLSSLLQGGIFYPRDIDGAGPKSSRWLPGSGWSGFADEAMGKLYGYKLPGGKSGDQHFAYANLYDEEAPFDMNLSLSFCDSGICSRSRSWSFSSPQEYFYDNPQFCIRLKHSEMKFNCKSEGKL